MEHPRKSAGKEHDAVERRALEEQAQGAAVHLTSKPAPVRPRFITDNGSIEKIETMLVTHRRLAILDDEGSVFAVQAGRYSKGPNYDVILKVIDAKPIRVTA